jgi:hypothetical protein
MAERDAGAQPLSLGRSAIAARHVGGSPGLVDEDELFGIEIELAVEPGFAPFQDVGAILLGRVRGLFLNVIPRLTKNRQIDDTPIESPLSASAA